MKRNLIALACLLQAGIASADGFVPWDEVLRMADVDNDARLSPEEVFNFSQRDHYLGFQPFMAGHFAKYDFNKDGYLSIEECRKGVKQDGYSDAQLVAEFKRDHGFRPWTRDE